MVWMDPRRSQVAFWRLFPNLAFKRKPTGKFTGGHMKSTGGKEHSTRGLQEEAKSIFHCLKV